jgi:hypothetical protein
MHELEPAQRKELIQDLNRAYGMELADYLTAAQLEVLLAEKLNALIRTDFGALVQLLYRIDINEKRLREVLKVNAGEDAGKIIAGLIMERQWQKIETRRQFKATDTGSEEERW